MANAINSHPEMSRASLLFPDGWRLSPFSLFRLLIVIRAHMDMPKITISRKPNPMIGVMVSNSPWCKTAIVSIIETIGVIINASITLEKYNLFPFLFFVFIVIMCCVFLYCIYFCSKVNLFSHSQNFVIYFFSV